MCIGTSGKTATQESTRIEKPPPVPPYDDRTKAAERTIELLRSYLSLYDSYRNQKEA